MSLTHDLKQYLREYGQKRGWGVLRIRQDPETGDFTISCQKGPFGLQRVIVTEAHVLHNVTKGIS